MALLELHDLKTFFKSSRGLIKAVNGASYEVEAGRTLGVVGESGSGKSVSALSILHLLDGNGYIAGGQIIFDGRDITHLPLSDMYKLRGNDISMIFQEPMTSLNPVFSVEKQVSEPFLIHQGLSKDEAKRRVVDMLRDVKIPNPEIVAKQYPHQLSGGMRQRVMIAMALACRPKLLIADEPTTALDVTIQAQILRLMNELKREHDTSIMFITHDLGVINQMADDVAVMYCGQVVELAPTRVLFDKGAKYSTPTRRACCAPSAAGYAHGRQAGCDRGLGAPSAGPAAGLQVRAPLPLRHGKVPPGGTGHAAGGPQPGDQMFLSRQGGPRCRTISKSFSRSATSSSISR